MLKGLLAGGIALGFAAVFPEGLVFQYLAVILALLAGVFPGMAMADAEGGRALGEWVFALLLVTLGLAGLWASPANLALAYVLHGLWAFLHMVTGLGEGTPRVFVRFCLTFDLVLSGFALYVLGATS